MTNRNTAIREKLTGWLEYNTPPGFPWKNTLKGLAWAGSLSLLWSLSFFYTYLVYYDQLFQTMLSGKKILQEGAVMADFGFILKGKQNGFLIIALAMIGLAVYHYTYFYHGSKSIYLMKRLPRRSELWHRCIVLPVAVMVASMAVAAVLTLGYYAFYMAVTPPSCLTPGQWETLVSVGILW